MHMQEHFFQCPYCWEEISMLLDTSVRKQTYIEDCEICCNPIEISVGFENNELLEFEARNIEQ
jgi:transcription elongation factor Elf1